MKVTPTRLPDVMIIEPELHRDDRGWFLEDYRESRFAECGLPTHFPQDNRSYSKYGVLRGLHYQRFRPQGKLVSCLSGEIWDVAVDIRRGSPTFGQWVAVALCGDTPRQVWVPPGFAHGFCVMSEAAQVSYKCTEVYLPAEDRGLLWSDPDIAIAWPIAKPLLSAKDRSHRTLRDSMADLPEHPASQR